MEISATTYENRVNTIISLEAPSESRCGNYDVQANPSVGRSNFNERARFSRAIVGRNSIGGSYDMAKTEHETISWNNDAEADVGTQHIQVPKVFAQITTPNKKIKNNLLSIPDVNINGDFTDFGGAVGVCF